MADDPKDWRIELRDGRRLRLEGLTHDEADHILNAVHEHIDDLAVLITAEIPDESDEQE